MKVPTEAWSTVFEVWRPPRDLVSCQRKFCDFKGISLHYIVDFKGFAVGFSILLLER
jgi:hypothetical protein